MTEAVNQSAPNAAFLRVDVCVCTFRRESVSDLIASLARMQLPTGAAIRIIVADNDDTPSAQSRVNAAFAAHKLDGVYLHAPARNISIARNACLDRATAPLVAFVDDDETVRPDWLARLLARQAETRAAVVFGRVAAVYPAAAPAWLAAADMHSTEVQFRDGAIDGGYTCNVLMRREIIGGHRFNPAFGRSGGEDTTFFAELQRAGAVMAYASDAVVDEPVTPGRASLKWLQTRAFRSGQTYGLLRLSKGDGRFRVAALSLAKIAVLLANVGLTVWSPVRWRKAWVRLHLHGGIMAAAMGKAPVELYGAAHA
jgi:succinoglycan biosynthesis protein ExoM